MIKGIGIDSVEIDRVARIFGEYGERFLRKIYTEGELRYFDRLRDPVPGIAGRFAAKEACMKALGTGWNRGVRWNEIEVVRLDEGKPHIELHGRAKAVFGDLGATAIHCTITHSKNQATSLVIME
jgi:holo-[acyl-carrier protein] synthase